MLFCFVFKKIKYKSCKNLISESDIVEEIAEINSFFRGLIEVLSYILIIQVLGCPRGVMVKAMNSGIVVREFVLQSRYYVHFRANTLGKGMNPLILPPAMGK